MDERQKLNLTMVTFIIGLMLSIQFQSVHKADIRDTRDTWQLREDLQKEKELQSKLIREVMLTEEKIAEYETERKQSKEMALRNTLNELRKEAGLTEVKGPGLIITIDEENQMAGSSPGVLSADLLQKFLNELKRYGGKEISVGGQRVINTTAIREISNETKINGRSLNRFPIEIRVLTEDFQSAGELYNRMEISESTDAFFIDNLRVNIGRPQTEVVVPAYKGKIQIQNIESIKLDKGGSS